MKQTMTVTGRCLLAFLAVPIAAPSAFAAGIFEVARDIGGDPGGGSTEFLGYAEVDGKFAGQYLITGPGGDIGGTQDRFHLAYREMSGAVRISAVFEWAGDPRGILLDAHGKCGVMIRASGERDAVNYFTGLRSDESVVQHQWRAAAGGNTLSESGNANTVAGTSKPARLGIQRVLIGGMVPAVESIVDRGCGAGWERVGTLKLMPPSLPDKVLVGVAVTSHSTWDAAQVIVSDVIIETKPQLLGPGPAIAVVPAAARLAQAPGTPAGFRVRSIKAVYTEHWNAAEMNKLLDFGCTGPICLAPGMPIRGAQAGERSVPFVNLFDTGGRGEFTADNGYPDETYPGLDPHEIPAADPAGGDDDDNFATEVTAIVSLTAGIHVFGASHDGSLYFKVGGVHTGVQETRDAGHPTDFIFTVEQDGCYELNVRSLAGDGGAQLELHEVIKKADGTLARILLGDAVHGGSRVFAP